MSQTHNDLYGEIKEAVGRYLDRAGVPQAKGQVRVIYTVTADGKLTNVRADLLGSQSAGVQDPNFCQAMQGLEASVAASLEGEIAPSPDVGRQQTLATFERGQH